MSLEKVRKRSQRDEKLKHRSIPQKGHVYFGDGPSKKMSARVKKFLELSSKGEQESIFGLGLSDEDLG